MVCLWIKAMFLSLFFFFFFPVGFVYTQSISITSGVNMTHCNRTFYGACSGSGDVPLQQAPLLPPSPVQTQTPKSSPTGRLPSVQISKGMPPQTAQSPNDYSPPAPAGKGMSPVQSAAHPPQTAAYRPPLHGNGSPTPKTLKNGRNCNSTVCSNGGSGGTQQQGPPPPPPLQTQTPKSSPKGAGLALARYPRGIPPLPALSPNDYSPPAPAGKGMSLAAAPLPQTQSSKYQDIPPAASPSDNTTGPSDNTTDPYPLYGNESRARRNPTQIVIEVAVSVVGFTILCIAITCFLKRKHPPLNPEQRKLDVQKFILHHGSLAPTRYKYSEIKKMTKSFSDKLGQGGYGSVYKGELPDGRHVAVKLLTETDTNSSGEEFTNEVASISRTSHVNIVTLLGFCHDRNKRAIIYEYMPNKSLDKFLKDSCLDLKQLFRIAVGIARGLEYLHTGCATRIVHFDIKPQNILLDDDLCPKISDFGLARLCKRQQSIISSLGMRGTIGYIAPEVFSRNFGGVSHKSDVYSYGMMLLEMAGARQITHESIQSSSCENYFSNGIYEQVVGDVVNRKVEEYSIIEKEDEEEARRKMFLVGFWCIQSVPLQRPSISKVVEMLEGSLQSLQIPPKPVLFHPNITSPTHETSSVQTIEARSQQVRSN